VRTLAPAAPGSCWRRGLSWLTLSIVLALSGCATTDNEDELAERVDATLAPLVAANEFSGAIVMMRGDRVVYGGGFGMANHAENLPFGIDTPADGGSMAKTLTAAGVWWLVNEGRIEVDAPVTKYIPEYPHAETTVRRLISHTNGLPPYYEFFDPYFQPGEIRTTSALLRVVSERAPMPSFAPGTQFEYSNLGFDAAALVIERVTGQSYEQFLEERFFERLGMRSSFPRPARLADWSGVRTMGYRWRNDAWQVWDVFDSEAFLGASNLYFSAADLARWASANAAGTAVPPAVLEAGQRRPLIDNQPSPINGLSWYSDASGNRHHYTGALNAFQSLAYWDRERNEAVAFVSNSATPPWKLITLQRALVSALLGESPVPDPEESFVRLDPENRSTFAGAYHSGELDSVIVALAPEGEGLRVRVGAGLDFDMFPVGGGVFYVPGLDWLLAFTGGEAPTSLHVRSMYIDSVLGRVASSGSPRGTPLVGKLELTASMSVPRAAHTATLLTDGRVLVVGGFTNEENAAQGAEVYEPEAARFSPLPRTVTLRHSHTSTVLPSGRVLIVGGFAGEATTVAAAELFDPVSNSFTSTGSLLAARAGHVAVLLESGKVLIAGGVGPGWSFLSSAELYDPATESFSPTSAMTVARESHAAVRLQDGRVLIAGGHRGRRADIELYTSAEAYDPATGIFERVGDMRVRRHKHDALLLSDGRVLITGGADERDSDGVYNSTEFFDPVTGAFTLGPPMKHPRYKYQATSMLQPSGLALLAGGAARAETYDPISGTFATVRGDARLAGQFSAVAPLSAGGALVTGGYGNGGGPRSSAWLYRP